MFLSNASRIGNVSSSPALGLIESGEVQAPTVENDKIMGTVLRHRHTPPNHPTAPLLSILFFVSVYKIQRTRNAKQIRDGCMVQETTTLPLPYHKSPAVLPSFKFPSPRHVIRNRRSGAYTIGIEMRGVEGD